MRESDQGALIHLRRGLLLVVAAAVIIGLVAGLARLGVPVAFGPHYATDHGPLLVVGAFGTVIALERAVAWGRRWGYAAPLAGAMGAAAMLSGFGGAGWLCVVSSVVLAAINGAIVGRQCAAFTLLMLLGSLGLITGNVAWMLGDTVHDVVPTWMAFFVLTIAAERLELSRLTPTPPWATKLLVVCATTVLVSAGFTMTGWVGASQVMGATMAATGLWQLRFDIARKTVRRTGLPRFSAVGVLLGAAWLAFSGVVLLLIGFPSAGPHYDATLHGVFVGYVLSMVLAHAPIILPAVAKIDLPFHRRLWIAPVLLHGGLLLRVIGDFGTSTALRQCGAALTVLALVAFVIGVVLTRWGRARTV